MNNTFKYKVLTALMILSGHALASDLIFKSGFENQYLIGGTVVGLESSPLVLELISVSGPDEISVESDGTFFFDRPVNAGHAWRVEVKTLPNNPQQQTCQLSNNSGSALPVGGVDDVVVNCQTQAWEWDVMSWNQGGWN